MLVEAGLLLISLLVAAVVQGVRAVTVQTVRSEAVRVVLVLTLLFPAR